jgi:glutaredoxin
MNFVVYSKDGCPYCTKIKDVLRLSNHFVEENKLGRDFTKQDFYEKFGYGATFPQVLYGEQKLGGCSDTIKFLKEQKLLNV